MSSGLPGTPHPGSSRHVRMVQETDWGEVPAVPSWLVTPYLDDGMGLKARANLWTPDTNFGGAVSSRIKVPTHNNVEGDFTTALWPHHTSFLIAMAMTRLGASGEGNLNSYTVDHFTPVDPRRYLGAMARSMRLAVSGTGDQDTRLTLGLVAAEEIAHPDAETLSADDFDYDAIEVVPFLHSHSTLRISTILAVDVEQWEWASENELALGPYRSGVTTYMWAARRTTTLSLTKVNYDGDLNDALRAGVPVTFEANFIHPAGHLLQVKFPRLFVAESPEDGTPSKLAKESPRFEAAADDRGIDVKWAVDLAGGGTTTMPGFTTTTAGA